MRIILKTCVFFASLALVVNTCFSQDQTPANDDGSFHATPKQLFARFVDIHNSGKPADLLPLLSKKSKAMMLFSSAHSLGMASKKQRSLYSDWELKWQSEYTDVIKDAKPDWKSDYSTFVVPLSTWGKLDDCLKDFGVNGKTRMSRTAFGEPRYATELADFELNKDRGKASVKLLVNGGIISGLNGNSLKWLNIEPVPIYFIEIDKKWYVCNESEYLGTYTP